MESDHDWQPMSVQEAVAIFSDAPFRWWISGGYALELHLGRVWRTHDDVDVGVCRVDTPAVFRWLADWDLWIATAGRLLPWNGHLLEANQNTNNVWARSAPNAPWRFDLTVGSGTPDRWEYRRDTTIQRTWGAALLEAPDGIPYLAPEIQLLFKSKDPRPKDHEDARLVVPMLDAEERRFLSDRLPAGHPWHSLLRD